MNSFDICLKEADIAYMEACNAASIFSDACEIEMYTEEAQSESILQKCKKKIKTLLDKVVKAIQTFCTSNKLKNDIQKMEDMSQDELNKMKCEILDENKKKSFIKKYSDRIKNAKSADEVNAIMDEYRKKKKITKFTVVVSGVALLAIARKRYWDKFKSESVKKANEAFDGFAKSVDNYEKTLKEINKEVENIPKDDRTGKDTNKGYGKLMKSSNEMHDSFHELFSADKKIDHNSKKYKPKYTYDDIRKLNAKISATTELEADFLGVTKDAVCDIGDSYNKDIDSRENKR